MSAHRTRLATAALVTCGLLGGPALASARPIVFPNLKQAIAAHSQTVTIPGPPCPENGLLYPPPVSGLPTGNCGIAQPVATGTAWPGPMAYFGGHVQVHPKEYLVLWGWNQPGAFGTQACKPSTLDEVTPVQTLACDPDGAARYMAEFLSQMGGSGWADTQTQYYEIDASGRQVHVSNDRNVLAGIWIDDANNADISKTSSSAPADPSTNTYTALAAEATRAVAHFGISQADLISSNVIIAQAPAFSDPNALKAGYCAFHDYTIPEVPGNDYYRSPAVGRGIPWTNIPYQIAPSLAPVCGKDSVNAPPRGDLDGFSIVLGHEVEETITDPGAESVTGTLQDGHPQKYYGGWYDATDPNENGDKCSWIGVPLIRGLPGEPRVLPVPGAVGTTTGNRGDSFAVQSLWSNSSAAGTGYCAGAGTDLPGPPG